MTSRAALARRLAVFFAATALFSGCTGIRLGRNLHLQTEDWPAFGRTAAHSNFVPRPINPPLSLAWQCDVSAGIANGAPIIVDSLLIVGTMRGELYAIRTSDGKQMGWVGLGDAVQGSPVANGNSVIVPLSNSKESIVSFDMPLGGFHWKQSYGDVETSLLLVDHRLFFGTTSGTFFCVEASTGQQLWSFALPSNTRWNGIRSSPAAWDSTVVFGADDGVLYALQAKNGVVKWAYPAGAPIAAPPAISSTGVVVGTIAGRVVALHPETGNLQWSVDAGSPVYGHVLITPEVIIVATTGGELLGLSPTTGAQLWNTKIGSPMVAGPAAAGRTLFIGTLKREIFAVNITDGTIAWKGTTEGRIKTSPVIGYGMVFFATDDRSILAYTGIP